MSADFTPEKEDLKVLTPFKMQVLTNFPYIEADFDALTNYQLLCKIVEYLNEVIAETNEVTEQTLTLYNAFVALQNYVNTYFDNLDLQPLVDEKLNEMAESGELADMIAEYIKMQGQLVYNTIQEMKEAENIQNGSFLKTYGFYNYNDGGGALYKARTITNEDTIDNMTLFALHDNTLVAELINNNLTPKKLGSYCDGVHDDLSIFNKLLTLNNKINCDDYGLYYISDNLELTDSQELNGNKSTIYLNENISIKLNGRFININDINLMGNVNHYATNGILFESDTTSYRINLNNINIYYCNYGIHYTGVVWNCSFKNLRLDHCNIGIYAEGSSMVSLFENLHFNRCPKNMDLSGFKGTFISCNFGIIASPSIFTQNNTSIIFDGCNFECDEIVTGGTNSILTMAGRSAKFTNCLFKIKASSTSHVFETYTSMDSLVFEDCVYDSYTGNEMPDTNFFNASHPSLKKYGSLIFNYGNSYLPRPDFDSTYLPYWIDREQLNMLQFYQTNIDKTKLTKGMILYSITNNCICMYDGTNIIKVSDGTIII